MLALAICSKFLLKLSLCMHVCVCVCVCVFDLCIYPSPLPPLSLFLQDDTYTDSYISTIGVDFVSHSLTHTVYTCTLSPWSPQWLSEINEESTRVVSAYEAKSAWPHVI